ncbi:hypothetical protein Q7C36_009066 [Tachysurus vachellii]|uniref:Uncharacterized protein n=1 Tax=Tachysurus vachellii TaxID=175792 RepID=A0AA88N3K2_TACVA|nr:hypothetical protein Q7C36_009066 [Tachysurus vachellii]
MLVAAVMSPWRDSQPGSEESSFNQEDSVNRTWGRREFFLGYTVLQVWSGVGYRLDDIAGPSESHILTALLL